MLNRYFSLHKLLLTTLCICLSGFIYAQLQAEEFKEGIQNGFNQYTTKWDMDNAIITEPVIASVQYFNKHLNDQLDEVIFQSAGSIYFAKFQGLTIFALDTLTKELEEKLIDSPLVGYIVLNKEDYNSTTVLTDSVYLKLNDLMQMFQLGQPTYTAPVIENNLKVYFKKSENRGIIIFNNTAKLRRLNCFDINGKEIKLVNIIQITPTQVNFSFPDMPHGIYILAPKVKNSRQESIKFNW